MRPVLLDTHVLLWLLADDPRLGPAARDRLTAANDRLVSSTSLWEIAIKAELSKLRIPDDLRARIAAAGLMWLDVSAEHAWGVRAMVGLPHRDPFDRMLLAQAHLAGATLVTADATILTARLDPDVERIDARA